VLFGLISWLALFAGFRLLGVDEPTGLGTALRFLAADAFLVAAVVRLFTWRTTRDAAQGWHAAGLATASLIFPLTAAITPDAASAAHLSTTAVVTRVAALLAAAPMLAALRTCSERHLAVGLLGCAVVLRLLGRSVSGELDAAAPGLLAAAAVLLAGAAIRELRATWPSPEREDALELELAAAEARLERAHRQQRERLHDARSAVAGVLGASAVLADDRAPLPARAALQQALAAELARLAGVLGVAADEPITTFDIATALRPTLELHALECPGLTWDIAPLTVTGRARATATALDNLLRNARVHAPGAAVRVWARRRGEVVEIGVDDDGPGIAPDERELVLQPGVRGGNGRPGSGLGLSNVAGTMRAQDGDVELLASDSGGTRVVLSLPAAAALRVA
jgi:signal transduction histidine kinase